MAEVMVGLHLTSEVFGSFGNSLNSKRRVCIMVVLSGRTSGCKGWQQILAKLGIVKYKDFSFGFWFLRSKVISVSGPNSVNMNHQRDN